MRPIRPPSPTRLPRGEGWTRPHQCLPAPKPSRGAAKLLLFLLLLIIGLGASGQPAWAAAETLRPNIVLILAAGLATPAAQPADGLDLAPSLRDPQARRDPRTLCFHYPQYYHAPPSTPASAVRVGPWKLIEYFENRRVELYHLAEDPAEKHNLAPTRPEQAAELHRLLDNWRRSVGAELPQPNPDFRSNPAP